MPARMKTHLAWTHNSTSGWARVVCGKYVWPPWWTFRRDAVTCKSCLKLSQVTGKAT